MAMRTRWRVSQKNSIPSSQSTVAGSQVDEQYLILVVMNDLPQLFGEQQQIGTSQLAFKHAVLQMIAPITHSLKDFA